MTDSEKGTPPSGTPESEAPEPTNADATTSPVDDVPEAVLASDPADPEAGDPLTVPIAQGEPVEVLTFVPPDDAGDGGVSENESLSTLDPDVVPNDAQPEGTVEELAFVPVDTAVAETSVPATPKTTRRAKPADKPAEAPSRYAVIKTGGKQYRVKVGDRIQVERLHAEAGTEVKIDEVLMLGGSGATLVGTPVVDGASVTAHVEEHARGDKIVVFKFKAKKRYRRRTGHRQELTRLTITAISG